MTPVPITAPQRRPRADTIALLAIAALTAAAYSYGHLTGHGARLPVAPQLHGTAAEFTAIAANNIAVCALLILAAHAAPLRTRWLSNTTDVLAAIVICPAAIQAGLIASHPDGPRLLPHAPLELAAVTLAAAWWWRHNQTPPARQQTALRLATVTAALLLAAAIETWAVPHR
jgi:hypothetical protein